MSNSLIEQAADINTHPDILRQLAASSIELARIVTKNSNTPITKAPNFVYKRNDTICILAQFYCEFV
ncbi:MAG: hypothetical protein KME29_09070 [Calothrix sp. FI2-JRJ7]|jgi:hypothetical protein|nr:hypothetical protein [Calothrix sp. FI2-JRJ7]